MIALGIDTGANTAWALVDVPRYAPMPAVKAVGMLGRGDRAAELRALINAAILPIECVGIEHVVTVFPRERFGAAMASNLVAAAVVVGELKNECSHAALQAKLVTAGEWRKAIIGNARATDKDISQWLGLAVYCNHRTNEHTRDAIGVAIYAARHAGLSGRA